MRKARGEDQMYLCVCHGVSEHKVKSLVKELAVDRGMTLGGVYRELGVRPRCASCVPFIKDVFLEAKRANPVALPAE